MLKTHAQENLEYKTKKTIEEYKNFRLTVNMRKTKYLNIGRDKLDINLENGLVLKTLIEHLGHSRIYSWRVPCKIHINAYKKNVAKNFWNVIVKEEMTFKYCDRRLNLHVLIWHRRKKSKHVILELWFPIIHKIQKLFLTVFWNARHVYVMERLKAGSTVNSVQFKDVKTPQCILLNR